MDDVTYRPAATEADLDAWAELMVEGFAQPFERARDYTRLYPIQDIWLAETRGRIVAGLGLCPAAQRWGGRDVPIDGVAAVTTAPDQRNRGLATGLMRATLAASRTRGRPLSALYPASIQLYRKAGYDLAGAVSTLTSEPSALGVRHISFTFSSPPGRPSSAETVTALAVRPLTRADAQALAVASDRKHAANGNLVDRGTFYWTRTWTRLGDAKAYGFFDGDVCTGGVILHRRLTDDGRHDIELRRYWADDDRALAAVIDFFDANGSLCRHVTWTGAPTDRLVRAHVAESWSVERVGPWMLRVVDLVAAFEGRGYARSIRTSTTLGVVDAMCPWNEGAWQIDVADGRARVSRADHAATHVDACGLARIYAGIDDLDGITAGPSPWLDEKF